jgi:hypothetical protein
MESKASLGPLTSLLSPVLDQRWGGEANAKEHVIE